MKAKCSTVCNILIIILIILAIIIFIGFTFICFKFGHTNESANSTDIKGRIIYDQFVVTDVKYDLINDSSLYITYDKNTNVEYYITTDHSTITSICPVYNDDGTIKIYKK